MHEYALVGVELEVQLAVELLELVHAPRGATDVAEHVRRRRCGQVGDPPWASERGSADSRTHLSSVIGPHANTLSDDPQPMAVNSWASSASCAFSVRLICVWIWHTRLSETPTISPISRSVRFLT